MSARRTLAASAAAVAVAGGVAAAGSHGGIVLLGVPVFAICVALAFILQWAAFVPAWGWRTERYFDLVGSATFLTLILIALLARAAVDARSLAIASMVAIWALRLGVFLFARIQRQGSDRRFDRIKQDAARFLLAWTLQGLWVSLTLSCALAAMTAAMSVPLGWPAAVGIALWSLGLPWRWRQMHRSVASGRIRRMPIGSSPRGSGRYPGTRTTWARSCCGRASRSPRCPPSTAGATSR